MGEPVSLKIRSDLYCHSNNPAASLPPSLSTSLSLAPSSSSVASSVITLASAHHQASVPSTNQPGGGQLGPNVFASPLQSSALLPKQTGSAFLPTVPSAHHPLQASQQPFQPSAAHQLQQSTSQPLPQDQCPALSRPPITSAAFQTSSQSRNPNTFLLSSPNYYRSSLHSLNTTPVTTLRTPEPNCLSNFNSNEKPLATNGSNNDLKTPQELSNNLVQQKISFKPRDSNQSPVFTSHNNNEIFENLNPNNPQYFAGDHDLGRRTQPGLHLNNNNIPLPQNLHQSTPSFQESFRTTQPDIPSFNMPPIEVPKDSTYSPSSSPPSSISSSVVPTKNSSANIENETTYPCSTAAFETSASFYGAKFVTSIETTSKCTLTSMQTDTALQVPQQPRDKSSGVIQGDFEENPSDTSCDVTSAHRGEPSSLGHRSNPPNSVDESQSTAQGSTREWNLQTSSCCVCSGHQRTDVVATAPVTTCSTIAAPGYNTPRSLNSENPTSSTVSVSSVNFESIVSAPKWRPTDSPITVDGRDPDSNLLNADPDRMSTPDILKMARYYKTMMPSLILPQSSADRGDLSIIQKLTAQRHLCGGSHIGRNEGDSGDIIDVVHLDSTNSAANSRAAEESGTNRPAIDVESLQFSSFIHRENIRQQLLREHGAKTIPYPPALYPKPSFPSTPLVKGNPSEGGPVAPCNEASLDLSTRPKGPTPRPESPFIPIQAGSSCHSYHDLTKGPDHTNQPSCLEISRKSPYSPTRALLSSSRLACLSNQVQERSGGSGSISKASEGGRSEGQLLDLPGGLPSSNLPPHILAWLLSSHLNPLQRAQQMSPAVGGHPPSSLLSLGSFYIPSPAESPDDPLLEAKPLDLSSKTLNSDPTVSWMTPDARCDHHSFGHKAAVSGVATSHHEALLSSLGSLAASFDKAESPAAESGSTDDGSVMGISRIHGLSSGVLLKQFGSSISGRSVPGLGAHGSLSTEDLITRVLEAKASGRGRRRTDQSKRSYTDTDLQAALRDIQNGKLGTRRAAVIYGIPRSTLRNKVYKLAIEKERTKKILEQTTGDSMTLLPMPEDAAFTSSETLRALLRNKMAIKLEEITKVNPAELNLDEDDFLERKQAQDPALGHLLDNLTTLALNSEQREMSPGVMSSLSLYPNLEDFTKKMIEKRYNEEIAKSKLSIDDTIRDFCVMNSLARNQCDLNLNVPSYEPACNSHQQHNHHQQQHQQQHQHLSPKDDVGIFDRSDKHTESSQRIVRNFNPVNFQDLIAHYMGQKTGTIDHKKHSESNREEVLVSSSTVPSMTNPNMPPQQQLTASTTAGVVKEKRGGGKKRAGSPVNNPGGKGSRPKRGKYRNYDRENLIKAVQAVQSGEMSVHRAGSFYGVPHSTLEYKVKERHLNRGKKKDGASTSTATATVPTKCTTTMPSRPTMVPTNSFTLDKTMLSTDLPRYRAPDDSTIDLTDEELSNARESAHKEAYHVAKKIKLDAGESEDGSTLSNASQNPFNLWNSSPSLLPPFMAVPYERDSFYASQMIRRFQEAATSKFGKDYSGRASAVSPSLHRSEQDSPMQGQSSGSCSPNLEKERKGLEYDSTAAKSSVLDALLRGKSPLEAAAASINPNSPQPSADFGANPWSVSSRLLNLSKQLTKAQEEKNDAEAVGTPTGTSGLAAFNALCSLPSVLGLQTSLAAALQRRVSPSVEVMQKEGMTHEIMRSVYPAHQASGITSHANSDMTYSHSSSTHASSDVTNASVTAHVHGTTQTESPIPTTDTNHSSELVGITLPTLATQAGATVPRSSGLPYISPSDSTNIYSQAQSITVRDQTLNMAGTHGFQECKSQTRERESTVNVVDNNQ